MIPRRCWAIRRDLSAFQDGELPVKARVAVQEHLRECPACAVEARELRELGDALRAAAANRIGQSDGRLAGLSATVVSRLGAERRESFTGRLERAFDDLHVVWAALGATGAAVACVAIIVGLFHFAARERPDSLAALIAAKASLGSDQNPMLPHEWMALPYARPDDAMWPSVAGAESEVDLVFLMDVLVSKEGQVTDLKVVGGGGQAPDPEAAARRAMIRSLSQAILKTRLQPAQSGGAPVAVNVVWLHAFLTVRGKLAPELRTPGRVISMLLPAEDPLAAV